MNEPLTLNCIALIREAAVSPEMRAQAAPIAAGLIADAFQPKERGGVRPSSFGTCSLALYARIHGLDDLAPDPIDNVLGKMDLGTLVGGWEAALLKIAAERDGWTVFLEFEPEGGGHIDALARRESDGAYHVVEFKSQWSSGSIPDPEKDSPQHLLQAASYAHAVGARAFTLVYLRPAAPVGSRMKQFEYEAEPYRELVAQERARLQAALGDAPPVADPQTRWACSTCEYSACARNKNKAADSAEMLFV